MRESPLTPAGPGRVLAAAAACVAVALLLAGRDLGEPGLYYDEVIQAGPALEFLRADGEPPRIPGARALRVGDRWWPWLTQPYMGALKSQALIPVFALAPPSAEVLRGATLCWALLGIPFAMLFANRLLGFSGALVTGALLATDPSLLFLGRHDWGSFALSFALRCAALHAILSGFASGSWPRVAAGGACLGLGLYNKVDFAAPVAGVLLALLIAAPGALRRVLREERGKVAALLAGGLVGALPLLLAAGGALSVAGAATRTSALSDEWAMKAEVARSVLDGSHFLRLVESGGRFEELLGAAPLGLGVWVFAAALLAILVVQATPRLRAPDRAPLFLALAALATLAAIALVPRALRAHHWLNVYPLPQLVVAAAAGLLWTRAGSVSRALGRGTATLLVGAALLSALWLDARTLAHLRETGGRGRWSHALAELARSLPPGTRPVSLDWGFDAPLRFVAPGLESEEPIWRLRRRGAPTVLLGGPEHLYLVHEPRWALMPYGEALLEAVASLPPDAVRVDIHRDRRGEPVLRSVRFARPHRLTYRGGRFEVGWR